MNMYIFNDEKWINVTKKACLFDRDNFQNFYDEIVAGYPFRFACTRRKFDELIDWIMDAYSCLDDCDYFTFECDIDMNDFDKVLIFSNGHLMPFDNLLKETENYLTYLKKVAALM